MFERYSDSAQEVVTVAGEEARQLGHPQIGTEHLLLGLLSDEQNPATRALPPGTTLQVVRRKVAEAVGTNGATTEDDLSFTPRAKRALERASRFSLQRHDDEVGIIHVLLGVLDVEGRAGQVLRGLGIDIGRLRDATEQAADRPHSRPPVMRAGASSGRGAVGDRPREVASRVKAAAPHCADCGAPLDSALAWCVLAAQGEDGTSRPFDVAYCSACGSALGAMSAPPR